MIGRRMVTMGAVVALVIAATAAIIAATGRPVSADQSGGAVATPRIIIDSDLSLWWDDATAIGMANVLQQRGQVRILGIMSDIRNPVAVAAMDAIDTAYGHPKIPLGAVAHSGANTAAHGYSDDLVRRLPHAVRSSHDVPPAVTLYRRLLAAQPPHSVTIVSIGAYTNLAGLLNSKPDQRSSLGGRALIRAKVKRLVIEDGLFPSGAPAVTNQKLDLASASVVVNGTDWPTPIAWVDGFTGFQTKVGGALCTTVAANNPMRIVYESRFGCGPPGDGDWDGPTTLYAIGGKQGWFTELGQGGAAYINTMGGLSWRNDPGRPHDLYVHIADQGALDQRIDTLLGSK
ncbi:MAG TPA: nucleoside hydrolase [Acidimicrobiales bacterium]|nr:nucleoside hydrolase [Acidimicrobiales bacterium]